MRYTILYLLIFFGKLISAQDAANTGSIKGVVKDKKSGETIIQATIQVVGTYNATSTDIDGNYELKNIKPGDYSIKISYIGYTTKVYNGIKIKNGETVSLDIELTEESATLGEVEVVGDKNLVDLESAKSTYKIASEDIKQMNARDVQQIVALQPGVQQTQDGIQIRGARAYETSYIVDGVSAKDPLAGTGFGAAVSAGSLQEVNVITGGAGAEYGGSTGGVVAAKIKEGGQAYAAGGGWTTDNPRIIKNNSMGWNTDLVNVYLSGPVPGFKKKVTFFISGDMQLTDEYTSLLRLGPPNITPLDGITDRYKANQLRSSILDNYEFWGPRQDNKWTNTTKLAYNMGKGMKITLTNQHSILLNQNTRTLQVIGITQVLNPGFQYPYALNLDNATTYTHRTNLTSLNFKHFFTKQWNYEVTVGRLFTNLRADANGRPYREPTIDKILDPRSITTTPVSPYYTGKGDDLNYLYPTPGPGFINNGGISPIWHDHYAQEYSLNWKFNYSALSNKVFWTFGQQHKEQELQWVDITSPWVGQAIVLQNGEKTPVTAIGSSADLWKVSPAQGGFFATNELRYKGVTANFGLRWEYWAYGTFADDAAKSPANPLPQPIKDQYINNTVNILGRNFNSRLLPNININFPVTDNNTLFFNYGHQMQLQHPRFVYRSLNPIFKSYSPQDDIGNIALRPEVTVDYEIGLKSQITKNAGFQFSAFYKDKFDYVRPEIVLIKDQTGQFVEAQIQYNQDYARIRGIDMQYSQRFAKWFKGIIGGTYQIATGKSNSAAEAADGLKQNGFVGASKEQFLSWDVPLDLKFMIIFKGDTTLRIGKYSLKGWRAFLTMNWKSNGQRYSPAIKTGVNDDGRTKYEIDPFRVNTEMSEAIFNTDLKISKDITMYKTAVISIFIEIRNLLDNKNSQIINPVTGRGYYDGDPLLITERDPLYPNPQQDGLLPHNPARFRAPRQFLIGLSMGF
ncbi:MAG: TonB-dependent receptor [Cytophagales bacterium]|nr:TonB-dependent receptor [Cytophagales bacterium]